MPQGMLAIRSRGCDFGNAGGERLVERRSADGKICRFSARALRGDLYRRGWCGEMMSGRGFHNRCCRNGGPCLRRGWHLQREIFEVATPPSRRIWAPVDRLIRGTSRGIVLNGGQRLALNIARRWHELGVGQRHGQR